VSNPVLITMFTDAGFCPDTRLATWAMWAKVNGASVMHSGVLRDRPDSSNVAEIFALANGMVAMTRLIGPPRGSRVIAQTDSTTAIAAFEGRAYLRKKSRPTVSAALDVMRATIERFDLVVEYRHVPGHRATVNPRQTINTWCDRECKRLLRQARTEQREAQHGTAA
jgi:ribonuclease HI